MGINAVSAAMYSNFYYNSSMDSMLPKWMVERLMELGVDPAMVSTVAQAKQIIQNIEKNNNQFSENSSFNNNSNSGSNTQSVSNTTASVQICEPSSSLMERIKALGQKVGVYIDENEDYDNLIEAIQKAIDNLFMVAANNEDKILYMQLCSYQDELNSIILEVKGTKKETQSPEGYLELLGKYNQAAIEINKRDDKKYL